LQQTTGLLILAPTTIQAKVLSKAYAHREIYNDKVGSAVKKYLALVHTKSLHAQQLPNEDDLLAFVSQGNGRAAGPLSKVLREMKGMLQVGAKGSINVDLYINEAGLVSLWEETVKGLPESDVQQKSKRRKSALTDVEVLGVSVSLVLNAGFKLTTQ
jgi:hypothetical protein